MIADGYFLPMDWRRETKGALLRIERAMKTSQVEVHNDDVYLIELVSFPDLDERGVGTHRDALALLDFLETGSPAPSVRVTIALLDVDQGEVLLERDVAEER